MITEPTVLVLGAGASMPYGFPSGEGLRDKVLSTIPELPERHVVRKAYNESFAVQFHQFQDALRNSAQASVDAFLEHRRDWLEIGKLAIAYSLIQCELSTELFEQPGGHWYEVLLNKMDAPFEDFGKNQVWIITFNYDRSLEQFFFTALKHRYNRRDDEVAPKVQAIPLVHVHGQLAPLEWQVDRKTLGSRPYEPEITQNSVHLAQEGIKIIFEATDTSDEMKNAHDYLRKAQVIHFLGFGYHDTNLRRLLRPFHNTLSTNHVAFGGTARTFGA